MGNDFIDDHEVVLRRIPPGVDWFEPPDRITSANFKLRPGEGGLSVYREKVVTPRQVLDKSNALSGSLVSSATAGEIRRVVNAAGEPLHLDVVPVDDPSDPGHAEIRSPGGRLTASASKALKMLFKLIRVP
ncbi:MAG TPA: hypothetical protein VMV69_04610 [Pirellulales bacterium]|nr:hypothetical protein [Pirellulales bacterium]